MAATRPSSKYSVATISVNKTSLFRFSKGHSCRGDKGDAALFGSVTTVAPVVVHVADGLDRATQGGLPGWSVRISGAECESRNAALPWRVAAQRVPRRGVGYGIGDRELKPTATVRRRQPQRDGTHCSLRLSSPIRRRTGLAPLGLGFGLRRDPWADAHGYDVSPLRGYAVSSLAALRPIAALQAGPTEVNRASVQRTSSGRGGGGLVSAGRLRRNGKLCGLVGVCWKFRLRGTMIVERAAAESRGGRTGRRRG